MLQNLHYYHQLKCILYLRMILVIIDEYRKLFFHPQLPLYQKHPQTLIFYIYIYRSYGYVAIEKYEHALEDLSKAKKISPYSIDKATIYNKWLSRGILKMDTEEYLMASKYFGKASLRFPSNKDAFCLNAISIVRSYTYSMAGKYIDNQIKCDKVMQTK